MHCSTAFISTLRGHTLIIMLCTLGAQGGKEKCYTELYRGGGQVHHYIMLVFIC